MVFNVILELMHGLVHGSRFTVHRFKKTINHKLLTINRPARAFTLVELLIVITLFGLTAAAVVAAYLSFERNQRLKNGALALKNDIRFVQNKALSGDKVADVAVPNGCPTTGASASTLVGWYIKMQTVAGSNTSYRMAGDCLTGSTEADFGIITRNLPRGVKISRITYSSIDYTGVNVLFRPLLSGATSHSPTLDFVDSSGNLQNLLPGSGDLTVELEAVQIGGRYQVIIRSTGEVSERKI